MGEDKAFLRFEGQSFIARTLGELKTLTDEIIVPVGEKPRSLFQMFAGDNVQIVNDAYPIGSPVGGMLSALDVAERRYVAVLACDSPLVSADVFRLLYRRATNHSAAVPIWENGNTEPLVSIYDSLELKNAIHKLVHGGELRPKRIFQYLRDIAFVSVDDLRQVDPELTSFLNINTPADLAMLRQRERTLSLALVAP